MIKCAFDISENLKNSSIVDRTRCIHELTNHTHSMRNIQTSNSEIDQTTNQLTIASSIRYRFTKHVSFALYSKGVETVLLLVISALERRSEAYLAWER